MSVKAWSVAIGLLATLAIVPTANAQPTPVATPPADSRAGDGCRLVVSPKEGLVIRSQAATSSARTGGVGVQERVFLTTVPATTKLDAAGRNWVEIAQPAKGWISNGIKTSRGNLVMCR